MVEVIDRHYYLQQSSVDERIKQLRNLALNSFLKIRLNQLPNHLIPASAGRYDDEHFNGKVWIKDDVRAAKGALDPKLPESLPELYCPMKRLYLSTIRGLLQTQAQPEQRERFSVRPWLPEGSDYYLLDDLHVPAIKFYSSGMPYWQWGNLQPDNWGTLLLETGKGIEAGWPVLQKTKEEQLPTGQILHDITYFVANLRTERLVCRSIWEHNKGWSSYSTRRIVLAGLEQMSRVWEKIEEDSEKREYLLTLKIDDLQSAADRLREKVSEHFPADYTDSTGHESAADLASLVVLNDIPLPPNEEAEILSRARDLENRTGFYRYIGDPWKMGRAEAKWTMGKPILAHYYFKQALSLCHEGMLSASQRSLDKGLEKIDDILEIQRTYGYIPELFEDPDKTGVYRPNNNELAWTHGIIIEAASAGITALLCNEQQHQSNHAIW